ncbi:MAG: YceI family protein [Campylobacterales bacterium]|nr:YceI family protein [Campylobacterales bacterium]
MKKIFALFLMMSLAVFAYDVTGVNVKFTAFKTFAKKGVDGGFDSVEFSGKKGAATIPEMLNGLSVSIKTKSVNSGNPERDQKLVNAFFNTQFNHEIQAKIVEVKEDTVLVEIVMNNETVRVPMAYQMKDKNISATGYIDLADFKMLPSLQSINKACYDLHEGKTWQDVAITFSLNFE